MFNQVRIVALAHPGQRIQRQAQAHGRVAGHQVHALIAKKPRASFPLRCARHCSLCHFHGQHIAHHRVQFLLEDAAQSGALHRVVQLRIKRIDVDGQAALAPQVVPNVFIGALHVLRGDAELGSQGLREALGIVSRVMRGFALIREKGGVGPHRLLVGAPVDVERPAWQLFAGVPLALAEVQEAALAVLRAQFFHHLGGKAALGGAERIGIPLGGIAVAHRYKSRLAAHRQAHIAHGQFFVHGSAELHDVGPLLRRVGLGDTG